MYRPSRLFAALLICVIAVHSRAWSGESPEYMLDIPKSSLVDALKLFSTQTGLQIGYWPDAHTNQSALVGPLQGKFTAEAALGRLLALSGLTFWRINERALVVVGPSLAEPPRNQQDHQEGVRPD